MDDLLGSHFWAQTTVQKADKLPFQVRDGNKSIFQPHQALELFFPSSKRLKPQTQHLKARNSYLWIPCRSFRFVEESLKNRGYVLGSSFWWFLVNCVSSGVRMWTNESVCHTEDLGWPNTSPLSPQAYQLGCGGEESCEEGEAHQTVPFLWSYYIKEKYDYQSAKITWYSARWIF